MNNVKLPEIINQFVEYTNARSSKDFINLFTENAVLNDWGRIFKGRYSISEWNKNENIGKKSQFEILGNRKTSSNSWLVQIKVTGDGFNGTGPMEFTIVGNLISSIKILPD
ncbi:ketosteroid isomerase [Liquorilactobacillus mali]|uniref:ketosteroid isomerase n=1 Tax=Liquorilactobacillus mali TaxID=1618 RepID=UPI002954D5F6|nr:ketosteroid isomerase [Liquorilactobacillus mali]MDV7757958.1 ketosteroid isomerase [Liquorilactobacillus mali]